MWAVVPFCVLNIAYLEAGCKGVAKNYALKRESGEKRPRGAATPEGQISITQYPQLNKQR